MKRPSKLGLVVLVAVMAVLCAIAMGAQQAPAESPVYVVAQIAIEDRETYRLYEAGFLQIFLQHGGEMLSVDESPDLIEGEWPWTRSVLARFPSSEQFQQWYDSPEYQELVGLRHRSSKATIIVVDGIGGSR